MVDTISDTQETKLFRQAYYLSIFTILFNLAEGIVSLWFGTRGKTLALTGFGFDSLVEIISGIGVFHMIRRIRNNPGLDKRDKFEESALRITAIAFYILTAGLVISAGISFYTNSHPDTTLAGIIISGISIATMYGLYKVKLNIGEKLNCIPVIADAECSRTCYYLSIVLLGSSLAHELANVPYIDIVGCLGIAWFAYQEGKESFQKLRNHTFLIQEEKEEGKEN